jgi:transcriptional regulator with XRE-family HTH domain
MNIINKIKACQRKHGLSDIKFAHSLGVSPATWSMIKQGKRKPGLKFYRGLINSYPELRADIDAELWHNPTGLAGFINRLLKR